MSRRPGEGKETMEGDIYFLQGQRRRTSSSGEAKEGNVFSQRDKGGKLLFLRVEGREMGSS